MEVEIAYYDWNFMVVPEEPKPAWEQNKKWSIPRVFLVECQPFIKSKEDIMGSFALLWRAGRYTYRVTNVDPFNLTQGGLLQGLGYLHNNLQLT